MWRRPSKSCRILDILRKWNSIIALLFIQNVFAFSPGPQVFSVSGSIACSGLHFWRHIDIIASIWRNIWPHWFSMTKFIPNLVNSSWLWWIMQVVLTRQKQGNILNECCINTQQLWVAYMQEHCWKYYILLHFHFGLAIRFAWGTFKGFENAVEPLVNGHPYHVVSNQTPREGSSIVVTSIRWPAPFKWTLSISPKVAV